MRLFIGDRFTKQFKKMLVPYVIDPDPKDGLILYVHDFFGRCYVLSFGTREMLIAAMTDLKANGMATALCDIYDYDEYQRVDQTREIEYDDLERSY